MEGFSGIDGILTKHGVNYEQGFDWIEAGMQSFDFLHERFINTKTSCSIHNHYIKVMAACPI